MVSEQRPNSTLRYDNGHSMNATISNLSEHNVKHFKFQSQHFHKFIAAVTDQSEIKGVKALDRYSRLHGFNDFNQAHLYLSRQTTLIKSFEFPTEKAIQQECRDCSNNLEQIGMISRFYQYYFFAPSYLPNSRVLFNSSLQKMESFTHFPIEPTLGLWSNGDNLAVALARYFGASDLMEKQLAGVFMMFFELFRHDHITGFGFQDVLDMLHPGKFMVCMQLFKTELTAEYGFQSNAGNVHSKMIDHCSLKDLEEHQRFYFQAFSNVCRQPLWIGGIPQDTLFDKVYSQLR